MKDHHFKYLISTLAILTNIYVFNDVTLLIIRTYNSAENLGIIFLPITILIHSMITFSIMGFFNINQLKYSNAIVSIAWTICGLTLLFVPIYIPLPIFALAGLIFWIIGFVMIKYSKNLNIIPIACNMFIILIGVLYLSTQV